MLSCGTNELWALGYYLGLGDGKSNVQGRCARDRSIDVFNTLSVSGYSNVITPGLQQQLIGLRNIPIMAWYLIAVSITERPKGFVGCQRKVRT